MIVATSPKNSYRHNSDEGLFSISYKSVFIQAPAFTAKKCRDFLKFLVKTFSGNPEP